MDGTEIANAFNQQNDKKTWKARAVVRDRKNGLSDVVHFDAKNAMVALEYHTEHNKFAVKFNKFQGAWGDYIKGIARSLFTVLNTLKSAGLPFEAPNTLAGMVITATTTDDNTVYVAWLGEGIQGHAATLVSVDELNGDDPRNHPAIVQHQLEQALMPELFSDPMRDPSYVSALYQTKTNPALREQFLNGDFTQDKSDKLPDVL